MRAGKGYSGPAHPTDPDVLARAVAKVGIVGVGALVRAGQAAAA